MDATILFISIISNQPFRWNVRLANVRVIFDEHHIIYYLYIRIPLVSTYEGVRTNFHNILPFISITFETWIRHKPQSNYDN